MQSRSVRSLMALGLISLIGLVHCSSAAPRDGFADTVKKPTQTTEPTEVEESDDDDSAGTFDGTKPPPVGDDSACTQDIDSATEVSVRSAAMPSLAGSMFIRRMIDSGRGRAAASCDCRSPSSARLGRRPCHRR